VHFEEEPMNDPSRSCPRQLALLGALALVTAAMASAPRPARAVDPFEIQVYDGTANEPGQLGLELHLNHVFSGIETSEPPELPLDDQTHITLEPSIGITPYWELGAYFQTTVLGDGSFDYSGIKLRSKFVTPPDFHPSIRLGVNVELAWLPEAYDAGRFGTEVRPIAAFEDDVWLLAANPILDIPLAGPDASEGPSFEPALMAKIKIAGLFAVGLEYYGSFGPIADPDPSSEQLHYLYEVLDLLFVPQLEVNIGVGQGFTDASNGFVGKVIVGYAWQ
jgi:hypothetical protein